MLDYLPSGGKLRAFRRVVLVDGVLELAGDEAAIGQVLCEGISYGDGQKVVLREPGSAALVEIVGDCKDGDQLYAASEGKVSTQGTVLEGVSVGDSESGHARLRWSGVEEAKPKKKSTPNHTDAT